MRSIDPRVEHVVVLMLENRSFDHMLGFLPHPDPHFDGLRPHQYHNIDRTGASVWASSDGQPDGADPDHSSAGVLTQIGPRGDVPPWVDSSTATRRTRQRRTAARDALP